MMHPDAEILGLSGAARGAIQFTRPQAEALRLLALAPLLLAVGWSGNWVASAFDALYAILAVIGSQALFAWARGRRIESGGLVIALIFTLLLPAGTPVLHLVLGAVFGAVLGEAIFGGRGHSFLNPAVVGLAFVHFSQPGADLPATEVSFAAAVLGAVVLLGAGLADWRATAAALTVLGLAALAAGAEGGPWSGTAMLVVVFLFADFASVPLTRPARWLAGLTLGVLALLLETGAGPPGPPALIFAALLAAVFAPLLDAAVLALYDAYDRYRGPT